MDRVAETPVIPMITCISETFQSAIPSIDFRDKLTLLTNIGSSIGKLSTARRVPWRVAFEAIAASKVVQTAIAQLPPMMVSQNHVLCSISGPDKPQNKPMVKKPNVPSNSALYIILAIITAVGETILYQYNCCSTGSDKKLFAFALMLIKTIMSQLIKFQVAGWMLSRTCKATIKTMQTPYKKRPLMAYRCRHSISISLDSNPAICFHKIIGISKLQFFFCPLV